MALIRDESGEIFFSKMQLVFFLPREKDVPGRRVTGLPKLLWTSQLFNYFFAKRGEPFVTPSLPHPHLQRNGESMVKSSVFCLFLPFFLNI